jgi:hypothetical protein
MPWQQPAEANHVSVNIGLDIGAVSLKLAAVGTPEDASLIQSLAQQNENFFTTQFPAAGAWAARPLVLSRYRPYPGQSHPVYLRPAAGIL